MKRGILGSITALVIGAGSAWGQGPAPIAQAGDRSMPVMYGDVIPASGPNPTLMPPLAVGPPGDPQGIGPSAGLGPPPGPMYPMPGPYGAPMFQPPPTPGGPGAFSSLTGAGSSGGLGTVPRWWFDGEYLLWYAKVQPVDFPLLTTSAPSQSGILGQPSTIQLVPGNHIPYGAISGFRLSSGFFGDADRRFGGSRDGLLHRTEGCQPPVRDFRALWHELGRHSAPGTTVHRHHHGTEQPGGYEQPIRCGECVGFDHHPDVGRRGFRNLERLPFVSGRKALLLARPDCRVQVPSEHREPDGSELHHAQ